jgi:spore coat protein H
MKNTIIAVSAAAALLLSTSYAELTADRLLDPSHVTEIKITLPAADWAKLRHQGRDIKREFIVPRPKPFTYFKGDITIDGVKVKSVGIRKKGFIGSIDLRRPSLKIKFSEFQEQSPVKGLDRLTLNNNKQDTSQVSQLLSYRVFRKAGIHAPRSGFASVTVNGKHLGIYSNVESIKPAFLSRSFGHGVSNTGNLYEGQLSDLYTDSTLEVKINRNGDQSELSELSKLVSSDEKLDLVKLGEMVDIENFMRFWAVEGLINHRDGYSTNQNNFFFYFNPVNGLGYFIPWGPDNAWRARGESCFSANSALCNRLYRTDGIPERYRKTMLKLLDEVWDEAALLEEIDRVEKMLTPHLGERHRRTHRSMDEMREFISSRRVQVKRKLEDLPVIGLREPVNPTHGGLFRRISLKEFKEMTEGK